MKVSLHATLNRRAEELPGSYHLSVSACVILIGLPASGKTTFYQQPLRRHPPHISKDLWPTTSNKDGGRRSYCRGAVTPGFQSSSTTPIPRLPIGAGYHDRARNTVRVCRLLLHRHTREALGRNRGREGKARVPDVAIFTRANAWRTLLEEGFDELYAVAIESGGDFSVQPMTVRSVDG